MNDLPLKEILAFVGALVAVFLGAVLAELRTLLQGARERRRALRTLLYQLLELRHRVRIRAPKEFIPIIIRYLSSRGAAETAQELNSPDALRQLSKALKIASSNESGEPFAPSYEQAVNTLAPHDPIFAYTLRGKEGLLGLDRQLKLYYENIPKTGLDAKQLLLLDQAETTTLNVAYRTALDELAKKIRSVARKLSRKTLKHANQSIEHQDGLPSDEFESEINRFLDNLFAQLAADFEKIKENDDPPAGTEGNPKNGNT